jgi:hypothetical protein
MPGVTPDELARLQHRVLAAALGGAPLPGGAPLAMPDLQFAKVGEEVVLSNANLAAGVRLDDLPAAVRAAAPGSTSAWLQFAPAEIHGDDLTLALQVRSAPPGGGRELPLSTLTLQFHRGANGWTLAAPPAAAAS